MSDPTIDIIAPACRVLGGMQFWVGEYDDGRIDAGCLGGHLRNPVADLNSALFPGEWIAPRAGE